MPTYEYRCETCATNFDVVQSFEDDPLTTCPTCGSPVKKVFGSVGIVFKGSGFYKNDSRSGGSTVPSPSTDGGTAAGSSEGAGAPGSGSGGADSAGSGTSAGDAAGTTPPAPAPAAPAAAPAST